MIHSHQQEDRNFAVANGLNFSGTDGYLSAQQGGTGVREYEDYRVRAVAQDPSNSGYTNFGANVNLLGSITLTGNVVLTAGSTAVTGVGSRFAELKEGDVLINPVDSATPLIVASVTSDTAITLSVAVGSGDSYNGAITRKRNKIDEQPFRLLQYLSQDYVKTHTADAHVETRQ